MNQTTQTKSTSGILRYVIPVLVIVFALNLMFNPMFTPIMMIMTGDISAAVSLDILNVAKILWVLIGETWVISTGFYYVTKKVF